MEPINELATYFNFLFNEGHLSLNYKINGVFSKNYFASNIVDFAMYVNKYKDKDVYCTYNCLKTNENRKNENVNAITIVGLDVEYTQKSSPESDTRLSIALIDIMHFIERLEIKNYIVCLSGNGYHIYIDIGKPIKIKELEVLKSAYNRFIRELDDILKDDSKSRLTCIDRKDLAGILRVPTTKNTKCNRTVQIVKQQTIGDNVTIRKLLMKHIKKQEKEQETIEFYKTSNAQSDEEYEDNIIPDKAEDVWNHPLVALIFDDSLPAVSGWYSTIIFALQAIIKEAGYGNTTTIKRLETEINKTWNMTIVLNNCSANDYIAPYFAAINFCKKNGWTKHEQALKRLLHS